ncbi:hypothetical protein HAX54_051333, partial [Datura stramonium]|nr:hypothetical protein [Datura stramonium]
MEETREDEATPVLMEVGGEGEGREGDFGRKRGKKREEGGGANGNYLVVCWSEQGSSREGEKRGAASGIAGGKEG